MTRSYLNKRRKKEEKKMALTTWVIGKDTRLDSKFEENLRGIEELRLLFDGGNEKKNNLISE